MPLSHVTTDHVNISHRKLKSFPFSCGRVPFRAMAFLTPRFASCVTSTACTDLFCGCRTLIDVMLTWRSVVECNGLHDLLQQNGSLRKLHGVCR